MRRGPRGRALPADKATIVSQGTWFRGSTPLSEEESAFERVFGDTSRYVTLRTAPEAYCGQTVELRFPKQLYQTRSTGSFVLENGYATAFAQNHANMTGTAFSLAGLRVGYKTGSAVCDDDLTATVLVPSETSEFAPAVKISFTTTEKCKIPVHTLPDCEVTGRLARLWQRFSVHLVPRDAM